MVEGCSRDRWSGGVEKRRSRKVEAEKEKWSSGEELWWRVKGSSGRMEWELALERLPGLGFRSFGLRSCRSLVKTTGVNRSCHSLLKERLERFALFRSELCSFLNFWTYSFTFFFL